MTAGMRTTFRFESGVRASDRIALTKDLARYCIRYLLLCTKTYQRVFTLFQDCPSESFASSVLAQLVSSSDRRGRNACE